MSQMGVPQNLGFRSLILLFSFVVLFRITHKFKAKCSARYGIQKSERQLLQSALISVSFNFHILSGRGHCSFWLCQYTFQSFSCNRINLLTFHAAWTQTNTGSFPKAGRGGTCSPSHIHMTRPLHSADSPHSPCRPALSELSPRWQFDHLLCNLQPNRIKEELKTQWAR